MGEDIRCFFLKNGITIMCKQLIKSDNEIVMEDILMFKEKFIVMENGLMPTFGLVPLGFPANRLPNSLSKDELSILFEIELIDSKLKKIYEDTVLGLKSPHVVKPESKSKIIY
jgi:hypothetical protein